MRKYRYFRPLGLARAIAHARIRLFDMKRLDPNRRACYSLFYPFCVRYTQLERIRALPRAHREATASN